MQAHSDNFYAKPTKTNMGFDDQMTRHFFVLDNLYDLNVVCQRILAGKKTTMLNLTRDKVASGGVRPLRTWVNKSDLIFDFV